MTHNSGDTSSPSRLVERHGGIGAHLEADDVGDLGPVPLPQPGVAQRVEQRDVLLETRGGVTVAMEGWGVHHGKTMGKPWKNGGKWRF